MAEEGAEVGRTVFGDQLASRLPELRRRCLGMGWGEACQAGEGHMGSLNVGAQERQVENENRCLSLEEALIVCNLVQHILIEHPPGAGTLHM